MKTVPAWTPGSGKPTDVCYDPASGYPISGIPVSGSPGVYPGTLIPGSSVPMLPPPGGFVPNELPFPQPSNIPPAGVPFAPPSPAPGGVGPNVSLPAPKTMVPVKNEK